MKTHLTLKLSLLFAATALGVGTTNALAESLTMIAPTGTDTSSSGRAILYVGGIAIAVGQSGTGTGIIWDNTLGSRALVSGDGAAATVVTGLGMRTTPGGPQLAAYGLTSSGHTLYTSMDSGVTWGPKIRLTNTYLNYTIGTANTLGTSSILDLDGTSKVYFGFGWNQQTASSKQLAMVTASGGITGPNYSPTLAVVPASSTSDASDIQGVSGIGVGVGKRGANAYYETAAGAKGTINTLNGTAGAARAISNDGTRVFGFGTVTDGRVGNYPWMNVGFVAGSSGGTAIELPGLPGAVGYATDGVAYGASANGDFAVGMSYPGVEKAVLWDTIDSTVLDLTGYAQDHGILDGFTRLSRAYSVFDTGSDNVWITGEGVWSPDGGVTTYTRGFVLNYVPEPSTLCLMLLGLVMLRRYRR